MRQSALVQISNQDKNNWGRWVQAWHSDLGNLLQISLNEALSHSQALGSDLGPVWMTLADASLGMLESLWYCLVLRPSSVLMWATAISLHFPSSPLWPKEQSEWWNQLSPQSPCPLAILCVDQDPQGKMVSRQCWNNPLILSSRTEEKWQYASLQGLDFPCCVFKGR